MRVCPLRGKPVKKWQTRSRPDKARLKFRIAALLKADVSGIEQAIQIQLDLAIERSEIRNSLIRK